MADRTVRDVDTGNKQVSAQVEVAASASTIFALVADPRRHPELDGSGTVRDREVKGPQRLSLGSKFGVGMKQYGVPYAITSTVTAFEEDRLIEWQHPMGHRWRWALEEVGPETTRVTETFDYSSSKAAPMFEMMKFPAKNRVGIRSTLEGLARRFA